MSSLRAPFWVPSGVSWNTLPVFIYIYIFFSLIFALTVLSGLMLVQLVALLTADEEFCLLVWGSPQRRMKLHTTCVPFAALLLKWPCCGGVRGTGCELGAGRSWANSKRWSSTREFGWDHAVTDHFRYLQCTWHRGHRCQALGHQMPGQSVPYTFLKSLMNLVELATFFVDSYLFTSCSEA